MMMITIIIIMISNNCTISSCSFSSSLSNVSTPHAAEPRRANGFYTRGGCSLRMLCVGCTILALFFYSYPSLPTYYSTRHASSPPQRKADSEPLSVSAVINCQPSVRQRRKALGTLAPVGLPLRGLSLVCAKVCKGVQRCAEVCVSVCLLLSTICTGPLTGALHTGPLPFPWCLHRVLCLCLCLHRQSAQEERVPAQQQLLAQPQLLYVRITRAVLGSAAWTPTNLRRSVPCFQTVLALAAAVLLVVCVVSSHFEAGSAGEYERDPRPNRGVGLGADESRALRGSKTRTWERTSAAEHLAVAIMAH